MGYFQKHVFVCANRRDNPCRKSCGDNDVGLQAAEFLSKQVKAAGLSGKGKVRVSRAGCLGRCEDGPLLVVYPEGRWYTYAGQDDLREIVEEDLAAGKPVARLLTDAGSTAG